jgi:hypothetical protein
MKIKFRLGQWVRIQKPRTDGTTDAGVIVGIEIIKDAHYLGFYSFQSFEESFKIAKYKVAYQNGFTRSFIEEWFEEEILLAERRKRP